MGVNVVAGERSANQRDDEVMWESRRSSAFGSAVLGVRQSGRSGGLLLLVGMGLLLAVVLICTVPLYTTLVPNVELRHTLAATSAPQRNFETLVSTRTASPEIARAIDQQVQALNASYLASFAPTNITYLEADTPLKPTAFNGVPVSSSAPLPFSRHGVLLPLAYDYTQTAAHIHLLAGALPRETAATDMPEVLATTMSALTVGNTLTLVVTSHTTVTVRVVGVWQPKDVQDPYWNGRSFNTVEPEVDTGAPLIYPLLFARQTMLATLAPVPNTDPRLVSAPPGLILHTTTFTDPSRITVASIDDVVRDIATYRKQLNAGLIGVPGIRGVALLTQLGALVVGLQRQFALLDQPLYIIVAQVLGVVLLFVVTMASLLVETRAAEIATLKSRGASTVQLLAQFSVPGVVLAGIAVIVGPFVAVALSLAIVRIFVPGATELGASAFGTGYLARAISPAMVARPALLGGLLGALALMLAVWQATRRDVLAFRREQGRANATPFWRRAYLDVALALLCAVGYLELGQFGGLNVRSQLGQSGSQGTDPLLLVAPGLLLVSGALLTLRLFPLGARFGVWVASRARGATGLLSFAQLARTSAQFSRLTLLLTLALGLGLFALTFQTSLGNNATDTTNFLVGSDERVLVQQPGSAEQADLAAKRFAELPGVLRSTSVYRGIASTTSDTNSAIRVLAIDSATFANVVYWRSDYADQPLETLLHQLRAHQHSTASGDTAHPIWALIDRPFAAAFSLKPGDRFTMTPREASDASVHFVVGSVIAYFPTLTDPSFTGGVVVDQQEYLNALTNPDAGFTNVSGPNEYWLRTTDSVTSDTARALKLQDYTYQVSNVVERRPLQARQQADVLSAGIEGLLFTGALTVALLAVLGSVVQSIVTSRRRVTQFAVLRTLGCARRQLASILLGQQLVIYLFGLLGGTVLGLLLASATLPYLQFSTAALDPTLLRLPPAIPSIDLGHIALFYAVLLIAFVLGLGLSARAASDIGLGKALRLGED